MPHQTILTVDPGLNGAFGIYSCPTQFSPPNGLGAPHIVETYQTPHFEQKRRHKADTGVETLIDQQTLSDWLNYSVQAHQPIAAYIEEPLVLSQQSSKAAFKMGVGWQSWLNLLEEHFTPNPTQSRKPPYTYIDPRKWKKAIQKAHRPPHGKNKSEESVLLAESIYSESYDDPPEKYFRGPRGGLLDGPADTFLFAVYVYNYLK